MFSFLKEFDAHSSFEANRFVSSTMAKTCESLEARNSYFVDDCGVHNRIFNPQRHNNNRYESRMFTAQAYRDTNVSYTEKSLEKSRVSRNHNLPTNTVQPGYASRFLTVFSIYNAVDRETMCNP